MIVIGFDRASTNWAIAEFVALVIPCGGSVPIYLHVEPCWLHGENLVKFSSSSGAKVVTKMHSLATYMRYGKNLSGVLDAAAFIIGGDIEVVFGPRPEANATQSLVVLSAIYGDLEAERFVKLGKDGERNLTAFGVAVHGLLAVVDGVWRH